MGYADIITADGPVAWYRLGEASGTTMTDETGDHSGSYVGTLTYGVTGAIAGDSDTAITLDGSGDGYGEVSGWTTMVGPPASIEAWIAHDGTSFTGIDTVIAGWQNGSGQSLSLMAYTYDADTLSIGIYTDVGNTHYDWTPADTGWHHVVGTVAADGTPSIYFDGTLRAQAGTSYTGGSSTEPFRIGTTTDAGVEGTQSWPGSIDEVAVYDYVLDATRVSDHYDAASEIAAGTAAGTGAAATPSVSARGTTGAAAASGSAYTLSGGGIEGFQVGAFQADAFQQRQQLSVITATGSAHSPTATTKTNAVFPAWGTGYGAAYGVTARLHNGMTTGTATGTGTAHNLNEVTAEAITATGTGTAIAAFWSPPIGTATGTGSATGTVGGVGPVTVTATGTGAAQGNDASLGPTAIVAEGTGTALAPTAGKSSTSSILQTATATGEALDTDPVVGATNVTATGTGAAANATATTVTGAYAISVLATATGTAAAPAATVGVAAGTCAGTAEAHSLDSSTTFTAGAAAATGAGYGTATKFSVPVGVAAGVGTAVPLSFALRPEGGIATSTGAALAGSSALGVPAGAASASGTAHGLTWSGTSRVSVTAGVATGTGLARTTKRGHRGGVPPRGHGHHWTPRAEAATVS